MRVGNQETTINNKVRAIEQIFVLDKRWIQLCYYYNTNDLGKTLSYNGLRRMG